jgi:hypothetical protein
VVTDGVLGAVDASGREFLVDPGDRHRLVDEHVQDHRAKRFVDGVRDARVADGDVSQLDVGGDSLMTDRTPTPRLVFETNSAERTGAGGVPPV